MFNSPIPFTKTKFIPGYYIQISDIETGFSTKIYKETYVEMIEFLEHISRVCNTINNKLSPIVFIEYFSNSFSYYTSTVDLKEYVEKTLEQKYNASIMWKTSANR